MYVCMQHGNQLHRSETLQCICICVYMYCICISVCMYACMYVCNMTINSAVVRHSRAYASVCICASISVCTYACMHQASIPERLVFACTCAYVRMYACISVCMQQDHFKVEKYTNVTLTICFDAIEVVLCIEHATYIHTYIHTCSSSSMTSFPSPSKRIYTHTHKQVCMMYYTAITHQHTSTHDSL
jgi:hypothetical protein